MNEERRRILNLLAEGEVTPSEAEALLDALAPHPSAATEPTPLPADEASKSGGPKFLRVLVEGQDQGKANKVNVRVPLELLRAGMRLTALLPAVAHGPVNRALKEHGVELDISKIKSEDLEGLVAHLQELHVDVNDGTEKVRVFCE